MAALEGKLEVIKYVLNECELKNLSPIDRWGNTPLDDASKRGFTEVVNFLREKGAKTYNELESN